jgi:hypothetical protein
MSKTIIQRVIKKLSVSSQYQAERYLYEIRMGTSAIGMKDDGSCTRYCKNCIKDALEERKRRYFIDRQNLMGKIFEVQKSGYYIEPQYKFGKDGKSNGVMLKRVGINVEKEKVLKYLNGKLKKEFPRLMKFSYECYDVSCSEYDGFELCDGCGVIFEQALLLNDQEIEHWESIEISKEIIADPYYAYQLMKIIDHWDYGIYKDRIISLAKKVIAA